MSQQVDIPELKGLCISCFSHVGENPVCPACDYSKNSAEVDWNKIHPGTIIQDRYVIGRSLGQGGFGITYLGFDLRLKAKLAIKEYYPSGLAVRNTSNMTVMNATRDTEDDFKQGMDKFLEEARTLARFEGNENIVSVRDFFEYHGTAYMVMTYLEGYTMLKYLKDHGDVITFDEAMRILSPVMDALDVVHASGLIHRDISPDNVYLTSSGQSKLLDFGAAKSAMALVNQQSHSIVLKKGYSPAEQYQSRGNLGPWTDVYSMAAVLYRSITGSVPPDSIDRLEEDILEPPSRLGFVLPDYAEAAIIKALSISTKARFQSMQDFKNALLGGGSAVSSGASQPVTTVRSDPGVTVRLPISASTGKAQETRLPPETKKKSSVPMIAAAAVVIIALGVGGFMLLGGSGDKQEPTPAQSTASTASSQTETKEAEEGKEESETDKLRKKAEAGDKVAQYRYGMLFQQGKGVMQDNKIAAEWFRKAAEQGYAPAQNDIGVLYLEGRGVPQDYKEALKWLTKAAEQNNPYAQAQLGWMYDNGLGISPNKKKAAEFYQLAADQGNANAQANLAYMCENGIGVKKDRSKAIKLYEKAANQGISNAQYMIGLYYEAGAGVKKNKATAIKWLKKAADQGDEDAINKLKSMGVR